jgi:hypothetical protein
MKLALYIIGGLVGSGVLLVGAIFLGLESLVNNFVWISGAMQ